MDTFPSGAAKLAVTCPHCQTTSAVQFPDAEHMGDIKAECGNCGQPFTFVSPHGSTDDANKVLGDSGSASGNG